MAHFCSADGRHPSNPDCRDGHAIAADTIDRSFEATNNAVTRLVEVGALRQSTAGRRNRVFEAADLFDLITSALDD